MCRLKECPTFVEFRALSVSSKWLDRGSRAQARGRTRSWRTVAAHEIGSRQEHLYPVPPNAVWAEGFGIARQNQQRDEEVFAEPTTPFEHRRRPEIGTALEAVTPANAQELRRRCGAGEPGVGADCADIGEI